MMRLTLLPLADAANAQLRAWQDDIDRISDYEQRVRVADRQFKLKNRKGNRTFDEIKIILDRMCFGTCRCCYCEDSMADEVEHIAPKALYPELTFAWDNYLYACGPCNGPKNNKYAIYEDNSGLEIELKRKPGVPVVQPPSGRPLLINPRRENPAVFFYMDIAGRDPQFSYQTLPGLSAYDSRRAEWTRKNLDLNRAKLRRARKYAYCVYVIILNQYLIKKNSRAPTGELSNIKRSLLRMAYPTVFQEMKRQAGLIPDLEGIFATIPEAMNWTPEPYLGKD